MPRFIVRLVVGLGIIAAVLLVVFGPTVWNRLHPDTETQGQPQGVVSDAFSLQLFHAMLETDTPNPAIAPLPLTDLLLHLREISAGDTRRELEQLQLSEGADPQNAPLPYGCIVAVDRDLPAGELRSRLVTRLPLKESVPQSLSVFNGMLCRDSDDPDGQVVDSTVLNANTQMLAAATANAAPEMEHPFHPGDTVREADFFNADGGLPHVDLMRCRAPLRTARAEDGSWEAVALFLKKQQNGTPVALVAILPKGDARAFAKELTPERLSGIRSALADAEPQDTTLEMPAIVVSTPTRDISGLMRRLGVNAAFDAQKADFSPITPQKIKLDALLDRERLYLTDRGSRTTPDSNVEYGERRLTLNRPFIWLLTDLSSPMPPHFIGLLENL
ncbi:MAG: hypothetical protein MJ058_04690 [Akkermansia sp.]|nr:hypothetical protein [Akkermansia sp.]